MKKTTLFIPLLFFLQITYGQFTAFIEPTIDDDLIVLVGPKNVDRYYHRQSEDYINKYNHIIKLIETELPNSKSKLNALENKKIINTNKIHKQQKQIAAYNTELELLEEFISYWQAHDKIYKESSTVFNPKLDSLDCYNVLNEEYVFYMPDFYVDNYEAEDSLYYHEIIDNSSFLKLYRWEEVDLEKEVREDLREAMKKQKNKRIRISGLDVSGQSKRVMTEEYRRILASFTDDSERKEYYRRTEVMINQ
ncbi:MAG: hypothetical protein AB8F74_18880, partial [Saprospiraceae bacterium]